jgi:hypothetical protein
MENQNLFKNLYLKQFNDSDAIAYNKGFISNSSDYNFRILDNAYRDTAKIYAKIKMAIDSGNCSSYNCEVELNQLKQLKEAPQASLDFLSTLIGELSATDEPNFDPNNNYSFTVANSILNGRPGFSKSDGYDVYLNLMPDGSQQIAFFGPGFEQPLIINNTSLNALIEAKTSLVVSTPDINKDMLRLLTEVGIFSLSDVNENGELSAGAKISEEYVIMNADGSFDYEVIDIGNGEGRNVLKYDIDKIQRKIDPFISAEVAGLLSSEQRAVAAWNVYISSGVTAEENDQTVENAIPATPWYYETDLPLDQKKKIMFETKYKQYFMNNYLKQFVTNKLPTVKEDAVVFDMAEYKKAKAQKFIEDNKL